MEACTYTSENQHWKVKKGTNVEEVKDEEGKETEGKTRKDEEGEKEERRRRGGK